MLGNMGRNEERIVKRNVEDVFNISILNIFSINCICKNSESYDTCEGETSEDETCNICEGFGEVIDGQYLCEDC